MVTLNLLENDIQGVYPLDPTSLVFSNVDPSLFIVDNNDGTVEVTGSSLGSYTFQYTVADTNSNVSNVATVTLLIQPDSLLPNEVGALVHWMKAEDIVGGVDGATIPSWPAAVGAGGTASASPLYVASGLNGLPAVAFSGSNTNGVRVDFGDPFGNPVPSITAMIVISNFTYGAGADVPIGHASTTDNDVFLRLDNGSTNVTQLVEDATTVGPAAQIIAGPPAVLTFRIDDTNMQIYNNLTQIAAGASNGSLITNNDWRLGAGSASNMGFIGEISEVVIYAGYLNDIDMLGVIQGFRDKYGI